MSGPFPLCTVPAPLLPPPSLSAERREGALCKTKPISPMPSVLMGLQANPGFSSTRSATEKRSEPNSSPPKFIPAHLPSSAVPTASGAHGGRSQHGSPANPNDETNPISPNPLGINALQPDPRFAITARRGKNKTKPTRCSPLLRRKRTQFLRSPRGQGLGADPRRCIRHAGERPGVPPRLSRVTRHTI